MPIAQAQFQAPPTQQIPQSIGQYQTFSGHPMMWFANNPGALWFFSVLWFVTWILAIAILVALLRWLWRKGDKETRR